MPENETPETEPTPPPPPESVEIICRVCGNPTAEDICPVDGNEP